LSLKIRSGALVSDAIARSGILRDFPEIDLATAKVGVYGKQVSLTPCSGIRIESRFTAR